jgi:cobalt ECF transporter T component CbiQ
VHFTEIKGRLKTSFLEKGTDRLANVIKSAFVQWETAALEGFFQKIDARIKILFLLLYIIVVSLKKEIMPEVFIGSFILILVLMSRLNIFSFYKRVIFLGFLFGFLIALPSSFNIITSGEVILPLLHLSRDYNFWVYHVPGEIGITREGVNGVIMLTLRVINSLSLSFLVLHTTPFPDIIKALKVMKVPDSFLMVITLTYKYIFIFAKTVEDMHLAKKSKLAGQVNNADGRHWVAGRIGFIFNRTRLRCEEIFKAMLSKGFSEGIKLCEFRNLNANDIVTGCVLLLLGIFFLWV